MPNPENLKPFEFTSSQNRDEARKNGTKGGVESGRRRRRGRLFREILETTLDSEQDYIGEDMTVKETLALNLIRKAVEGNLKAIGMVLDIVDEGPEASPLLMVNGGGNEISMDRLRELRKEIMGGR